MDPRGMAKGFPANVNVAAALSLAGIGPDKTKLQIWADPLLIGTCTQLLLKQIVPALR